MGCVLWEVSVDDAPCGDCASAATVLWLSGTKVYKRYKRWSCE